MALPSGAKVAFAAILSLGAIEQAMARCVTVVGDVTKDQVAAITKQAHHNRMDAGTWHNPADGIGSAEITKYKFWDAVEGCEGFHNATVAANAGMDVTTGLQCKYGGPHVIQTKGRTKSGKLECRY